MADLSGAPLRSTSAGAAAERPVVPKPGGCPQAVSAGVLAEAFGAAGSSVRLVVFERVLRHAPAEALLAHVDCVIGTSGALHNVGRVRWRFA